MNVQQKTLHAPRDSKEKLLPHSSSQQQLTDIRRRDKSQPMLVSKDATPF